MISHSPNNTSHSHSSSIRLMSSPVVCLSVCRRVVLAPIYLCSLLNMFAPSHSQPLLHSQKISAIETTSISILRHLYPYQYQHLPLFVLHSMHMCMNLLSVHVAPISLSILDVLATAFQLYETYAYRDHTDIDIWRCIYLYILPIIITLISSLSVPALSVCFSLLCCSVVWLLVMSMTWLLCCFLSVISVFFIAVVCLIQVLSSELASFLSLSVSTFHHSILLTVLALILVSILDFIAALSKKQLVDRRQPHISCLHSIILSCDNVLQPCVWRRG